MAGLRQFGCCSGCGQQRSLPGRRGGDELCGPCAGIDGYVCATCTSTARLWRLHECGRCATRRLIPGLLGIGQTDPALRLDDLIGALSTVRWPHVINRWLRNKQLRDLLRAIATGELSLTHETFMTIEPSPSGDHLRDLLVDQALLDPRHRELVRFEHWATYQTGGVEPVEDRNLIATYATWHHHRRLARDVDTGKLTPTATKVARQQIQAAITLLRWLRVEQGTTLADCQQTHIDRWFASGPATRQHAARFLTWARQQRLCPAIRVPTLRVGGADAIPDDQRVELVARLLHHPTIDLADRVAGLLVVLYAQPATRLTRLRLDAVTVSEDQTALRLGNDDIVLPEPVGQLVSQLVEKRHSTDHGAGWLFPGRIPGQPIRPSSIRNRLRAVGVTRAARIGAFHQLAQNVPAPVLADLIGYNQVFTAEQATALATGWATYAALRSRPPAGT